MLEGGGEGGFGFWPPFAVVGDFEGELEDAECASGASVEGGVSQEGFEGGVVGPARHHGGVVEEVVADEIFGVALAVGGEEVAEFGGGLGVVAIIDARHFVGAAAVGGREFINFQTAELVAARFGADDEIHHLAAVGGRAFAGHRDVRKASHKKIPLKVTRTARVWVGFMALGLKVGSAAHIAVVEIVAETQEQPHPEGAGVVALDGLCPFGEIFWQGSEFPDFGFSFTGKTQARDEVGGDEDRGGEFCGHGRLAFLTSACLLNAPPGLVRRMALRAFTRPTMARVAPRVSKARVTKRVSSSFTMSTFKSFKT